jgi:hypothetical protein
MSFLNELKRRNVIKVAIAYTVLGWLTVGWATCCPPLPKIRPSVGNELPTLREQHELF